jgi:hypothetical protein
MVIAATAMTICAVAFVARHPAASVGSAGAVPEGLPWSC